MYESWPGAATPRPAGGLLWRFRAAALLIVLFVGCAAMYLAAALLVTDVGETRVLLLVAAITAVGGCLVMVGLTVVLRARISARSMRRAQSADRAIGEVRHVIEVVGQAARREGAHGLMPVLDLIQEHADRLSAAEITRLRAVLSEIDAVSRLVRRRSTSRGKWARARTLALIGWVGGNPAVAVLHHALRCDNVDLAHVAAQGLAENESNSAYEVLLDALVWEPFPVARVAVLLEHSRCHDAVRLLVARSDDPAGNVRFWVAYLLGRSGSPLAREALARLAQDESSDVRASAAEALGYTGESAVLKILLSDPSWVVRARAARAAGESTVRDLIPELIELLEDDVWWVRQNAALALKRYGKRAISPLRDALTGDDRFARNKAAEVLVDMGFTSMLIAGLSGSPDEFRSAAEGITALARADALARITADALARIDPDPRSARVSLRERSVAA